MCCSTNCIALVFLSLNYGTVSLVWKEEGDAAEVDGASEVDYVWKVSFVSGGDATHF